jgi:glycosyltransferase involved in cell wall biosynthesis
MSDDVALDSFRREGSPNPQITIGLCVKDFERHIGDTMVCLLAQDFPLDLAELVVVDGCSKDRTIDIIRQHVSKTGMSLRVFFEKQGLGVARQIVVDNARGEYVIWIDGDMVLSDDYVRRLYDFMNQNPEVGIAKGKYSLAPGADYVSTLEIFARAAMKMVDFNAKIETSSMGTAGSIYRVEAIKQAGGFDKGIKGYGEDWDAERRVKACGWSLATLDVQYRDYERYGLSWKDVWNKYQRRGKDSYNIFCKNRGSIELYRWSPFAGFVSGLLHASVVYKLIGKKLAFLLPIQYALKQSAWCFGFLRGQLHSDWTP